MTPTFYRLDQTAHFGTAPDGAALLPRAATAGWFSSDTHPDLQAAINAARAKLAGGQ